MNDASALNTLLARFAGKDRLALSRLLTWAARGEQADAIATAVAAQTTGARVIAFTGSGGVGKSTLIARLVEHVRSLDRRVAVLACDPQSPVTGGALLGDRIRMSASAADEGVFIRSLATAGGSQAVAERVDVMIDLLKAFGFDVIFLETVGAGQGDTAVRKFADVLVLLLQPLSGDELQWEKAGLLEVADVVVINKSDLPGADRVQAEVGRLVNLSGGRQVQVLKTNAAQGTGIDDLWRAIEADLV